MDPPAPHHPLVEKLCRDVQTRQQQEREGVPMPTTESSISNLLRVISALDSAPEEQDIVKKTKSGQMLLKKSEQYETVYTDGSVMKGIHGVTMHMTEFSDYKGPRCANCSQIHDLKKCARCRKEFYCSKDCQTKHWKIHKSKCT